MTTGLFPELEKDLHGFADATTGILPSQDLEALIESGAIQSEQAVEPAQIQPASVDLRLGPVAHRVRASFLPGKHGTVAGKIRELGMHDIDLTSPAVLEKGCVYIVPLMESLHLPKDVSGKANPKSTTGRLDIFTRLITDYGGEFERVPPGYRGRLYLEIVPRTFSVVVSRGTTLNQLRLLRGNPPPSDAAHRRLHARDSLVMSDDDMSAVIKNGLWISVDLARDGGRSVVGYRAKRHAPLIDLARIGHYDPLEFWEPMVPVDDRQLVLHPDDFYILVSKERIRIPPDFAAAMVAYDPSVGEFRIHYAGFFDPGFGYGNSEIPGTCAVLEVRTHEVPFQIADGQPVGRLVYERLLSIPDRIYGAGIGSSYQSQGLALSKQFKPFDSR